jgi:hypothetical protein
MSFRVRQWMPGDVNYVPRTESEICRGGRLRVLESGSRIERIYKRKAAIRAEAQWRWTLDSMSGDHDGIDVTGLAATLDEAMAALQDCRTKMK